MPWHGKYLAVLLTGKPCRDERPRSFGRFDHHDAERRAGNDPVPSREILGARDEAGLAFADQHSVFCNLRGEALMFRRINRVEAAGQHSASCEGQSSAVRGPVNSARQAGDDQEAPSAEFGALIPAANFKPAAEALREPTTATAGRSQTPVCPRT